MIQFKYRFETALKIQQINLGYFISASFHSFTMSNPMQDVRKSNETEPHNRLSQSIKVTPITQQMDVALESKYKLSEFLHITDGFLNSTDSQDSIKAAKPGNQQDLNIESISPRNDMIANPFEKEEKPQLKKDKPLAESGTKKLTLAQQIDRKYFGVFAYFPTEEVPCHKFSKTSLCCMTDQNCFRQIFAWIATWPWFEYFITFAIVLNSIMLASTDYQTRLQPTYVSEWTPTQEKIDFVFSCIFIVEFVVKVIAMGFVLQKGSYLRDAWNCLDFFIVSISILGMLPIGGSNDSLKALRTFRILRPLRSINKMPTMRDQIQSLMASIPGIMRVFFFIIFIFTIFAIFGANQFMGQQYQFCRSQLLPIEDADGNYYSWPKAGEDSGDLVLCRENSQCTEAFPELGENTRCGATLEFGMDPLEFDSIREIELIMYGIPGFDNVGQGFLTIFQILTLESWVYLMYNFSDAGSPTISVIYFVLIVLLGAFFTMNLVLATIVDQFSATQEEAKAKRKEDDEQVAENLKDSEVTKAINQSKAKKTQVEAIQIQDLSEVEEKKIAPDVIVDNLEPTRNKITREEAGGLLPSLTGYSTAGQAARNIALDERRAAGEDVNEDSPSPGQSERDQDRIPSLPRKSSSRNDIIGAPQEIELPVRSAQVSPEKIQENEPKEFGADDDKPGREESSVELIQFDGYDEETFEVLSRTRSSTNGLYRCLYQIVTSVSFNFFIFLLIIGNTATLASYTYDQSQLQTDVLEIFNEFFTWIFVLEMIMKIVGLGYGSYVKDKYNLFDAVIVIISLVDWTISRIPNLDAGSALNAFRALRLLRMMKLSKAWKALAEILRKTAQSLQDIGNFSLLLFLFMYIFALLGMELFANQALVDEDDNLIGGMENIQAFYASGEYYTFPRDNFNNIGYALTTIFIVIIGEDWNWTMYQWARAYGYGSAVSYYIAVFFFLILMILGNIVLFSLFTAILLQNFEGSDEEEEDEDDDDDKTVSKRFSKQGCSEMCEGFKEAFGKKRKKVRILTAQGEEFQADVEAKGDEAIKVHQIKDGLESDSDQMSQAQIDEEQRTKSRRERNKRLAITPLLHYQPSETMFAAVSSLRQSEIDQKPLRPLMGNSLFCLGPQNCFRRAIHRFVENKWFQNIILLLIVISTITLALETPLDNPQGDKIQILEKIDLFMTIVFTFEAVVKIIAVGFLLAGKDSYIREAWNILDFLIVISALLGTIAGDSINVGFIKALRILKILRPLRIIARNPGLKIAILTLGRSIPNIVRLQVIVLFFVFLFAILQTTLFSGTFYSCNTDHLNLSIQQKLSSIETMWDCLNYGGEWLQPDLNFDSTQNSLLTLVTIQTTEGWIDVMWASVDSVAPYYQPKENYNPGIIFYNMILIIVICMLFIEMFVGVVIETYDSQKEIMQGNRDLTRMQLSYARVHILIFSSKPEKRLTAAYTAFRNSIINFTEHRAFDQGIMFCIMANTFVLGFVWYGQSQEVKDVVEIFNYIFMVIFTIEAILKIIAQRCDYFGDSWNRFDFTVVAATLVILVVGWLGIGKDLEILGTILRTLRIGRVFRLIKKQQKLQEIFKTLIDALPAMSSLGLLLMLLIFMFAIIGMAQFSLVDINGASEMNQHVNFQSFGAAFLTLIRCSTGEAWNSIMLDSAQPFSIFYQCEENESYELMIEQGRDPNSTFDTRGCGMGGIAIAFHLLFQVIVSQVFLNLFIAIIIDAFFGQTDMANMPVKEKTINDFQRLWSFYDNKATGFITIEQLQLLLIDLAKSHAEEGGALIPFKKRIIGENANTEFEKYDNEKFRQRFIASLEIPTYRNMREVMYFDVLIKLSFQSVKLYFQKDDIKNMQKQMKLLRKLGGNAFNDDTLEVIHNQNMKKSQFDQEFKLLIDKMKEKESKAQIVDQLSEISKKMKVTYNQQVDTDTKIQQRADENSIKLEQGIHVDVELYTTKHRVSAKHIHDIIAEYLESRRNGAAPNTVASQGSVVAYDEEVPVVRAPPPLQSITNQPSVGVTELEPDNDLNDDDDGQDQDWRNDR